MRAGGVRGGWTRSLKLHGASKTTEMWLWGWGLQQKMWIRSGIMSPVHQLKTGTAFQTKSGTLKQYWSAFLPRRGARRCEAFLQFWTEPQVAVLCKESELQKTNLSPQIQLQQNRPAFCRSELSPVPKRWRRWLLIYQVSAHPSSAAGAAVQSKAGAQSKARTHSGLVSSSQFRYQRALGLWRFLTEWSC